MPFLILLFRWMSGRPLDGLPRTDSSFTYAGTRSVRRHISHPSRWSLLPGWKRSLYRNAIVVMLLWVAYMLIFHPVFLAIFTFVIVGLIVTAVVLVQVRNWPERRHMRQVVKPLHIALCGALGMPEKSSLSYLNVPPSIYTDPDHGQARIQLPSDFEPIPGYKTHIEQIIAGKLAIESPQFTWKSAGKMPMLIVQQAPQPPKKLVFDHVREQLYNVSSVQPYLGKGIRGAEVYGNFHLDSPHFAFSYGSGGGKSESTKLVTMQNLFTGGITIILDIKRTSHLWARGLPGVVYCRNVQEIHNAFIALGLLLHQRNEFVDLDDPNESDRRSSQLPRINVLVEECNMLKPSLDSLWSETRSRTDPRLSPALRAFADIAFAGRSVKMNLLIVSQYMTAATVGNPAIRECCGLRLLARYTAKANAMLCPEVKLPPKSKVLGRVQVVQGDEARVAQFPYVSHDQARGYVTDGQTALGIDYPYFGPNVQPILDMSVGDKPLPTPVQTWQITDGKPSEYFAITLREAVESGPLEGLMSLDAVRRASTRDPEFPQSNGMKGNTKTYDPEEIERWSHNRVRASV